MELTDLDTSDSYLQKEWLARKVHSKGKQSIRSAFHMVDSKSAKPSLNVSSASQINPEFNSLSMNSLQSTRIRDQKLLLSANESIPRKDPFLRTIFNCLTSQFYKIWICGFIIGSLLIACIALAVILSFYLKKSPASTTVTVFPYQSCSLAGAATTLLFSLANVSAQTNYSYHSYIYTAKSTTATIMFDFRQDPDAYYLDNVQAIDTVYNYDVLSNGDFEWGTLSPWLQGTVSSGTEYYYDPTVCKDYNCYREIIMGQTANVHQTFSTDIGQKLNISFYIKSGGGPLNFADCCIYPF
ncbi:unnamed protein product [Didymodactylos carnosus]|uniref:Uncharacterized protein n=1 Tax=Didymodactylos carnosus TaxID=1234261 RepID=A0A814XW35_9BILA|nr:unnamed protein product [Didymodactylos carnosus]CAF1221143.1 unnamed protein product [Didymodactylos carnosus]CAF3984460.1 unnamed protein product [Didymodactylos carnosus]CAF3988432.1 unnamed protein product [Didymodactylos carnosus]